ncbi:hypothetical protein CAG58_01000 [Vibrio sp. V31_P5A7T61]|uniref:hypothetical protein n=1 Tax=unclassified Vibrio TaxID=2614977 RepID=UPI0013730E6B|nr:MULTISPECIES: hypothetical protein [unclassified Vibrio]NAW60547.1 hypothetical protein [Vibrio sp. V31_P5A7T61]NAW78523.1 hypothetical protein [Vibrio sp. V33_P6A3T137]NAX00325.1 hypothetical protein [Vibrio sp. V34_P3A8T189]NAX08876.1 hypothetical protein [Vibrio sp. V40_P2S30T141]NAX64099.1 hypothetical protein [Vibrio sp. V32_P6A28T40]
MIDYKLTRQTLLLTAVVTLSACNSLNTDEKMQAMVQSTYLGTTDFAAGTDFWNVIGSTGDDIPGDYSSWIQLYSGKCGTPAPMQSATGQACSFRLVGGHVVTDQNAQYPTKGDTVYIVPICHSENMKPSLTMTTASKTCAVKLGYRQ